MVVVGAAPDAYVARTMILALRPDVLTLDLEMPRMDGLAFLKRLMRHHPLPTLIVSSLGQSSTSSALEALRWGAVDVLAKPGGPYSVSALRQSLAMKIRTAASAHLRPRLAKKITQRLKTASGCGSARPQGLIAIGASTGGTVAIEDLLTGLPAEMPGVVITQHIPPGFSRAFAQRLNDLCAMTVREAKNGDTLGRGLALVAPGDHHLLVQRSSEGYAVKLQDGPQVCPQRPSVDMMFASVAEAAGAEAVGILLTGMGTDGAQGLLALRRAGAQTIAQDEGSCVVYGMPREAVRLRAVGTVAALADIPRILLDSPREHRADAAG